MRVLLVEDDRILGGAIRDHVGADGHAVDWVQCLGDAQAHLDATPYDLVLLDLMLPDGGGLELLEKRRGQGDATPIVILTARDQISDRIAGLNAGADDYLVKPFDLGELSARIAAVARRYASNPNPLFVIGSLEIDLAARLISRDGKLVDLTAREWSILESLLRRPGAILSRAQLEDGLYAFGAEVDSNTIEVHVSHMRKKLGHELIQTVRGVGYRLNAR